MGKQTAKLFLPWAFASVYHSWLLPFSRVRVVSHLHPSQNGSKIPDGLYWALAKKGITVKDKAFLNLKPSELQDKGAHKTESMTGLPIYVRGTSGASDISKIQFTKLLKEDIFQRSRKTLCVTLQSSSCAIPLISKVSPGQAAYHFLAGYEVASLFQHLKEAPPLSLQWSLQRPYLHI